MEVSAERIAHMKAIAAKNAPQHYVYTGAGTGTHKRHFAGTWAECGDWLAARHGNGVNYYLGVR